MSDARKDAPGAGTKSSTGTDPGDAAAVPVEKLVRAEPGSEAATKTGDSVAVDTQGGIVGAADADFAPADAADVSPDQAVEPGSGAADTGPPKQTRHV